MDLVQTGLDRQRLGRIGRGHEGEARSIATLETQLRRINPPESLGDMVFRKVLAVGEATFSLAASKAAAEKVAQEKADRLEAARLKFRQKKAEQLASRSAKLKHNAS